MGPQIPPEVSIKVFRLWFAGQTYREVSSETGVGLASITKIVGAARQKVPDID